MNERIQTLIENIHDIIFEFDERLCEKFTTTIIDNLLENPHLDTYKKYTENFNDDYISDCYFLEDILHEALYEMVEKDTPIVIDENYLRFCKSGLNASEFLEEFLSFIINSKSSPARISLGYYDLFNCILNVLEKILQNDKFEYVKNELMNDIENIINNNKQNDKIEILRNNLIDLYNNNLNYLFEDNDKVYKIYNEMSNCKLLIKNDIEDYLLRKIKIDIEDYLLRKIKIDI